MLFALKKTRLGGQMWALTNSAVQQRAQQLQLGGQLRQAEMHDLVVQHGPVKQLSLASVLNGFLYDHFQRCQDFTKQSTEQDIALPGPLFFFLIENIFFSIQTIHFYKQYIRFPKVNYSICSVWSAEFQLLKESGIPLYLWKQIPYPHSTWVPNCQTQRIMKGSGRNAAKSPRAVHNNKHVTLTLNTPFGALSQACGTPGFQATCVLNSRNNPQIKSEGRQCAHWAML